LLAQLLTTLKQVEDRASRRASPVKFELPPFTQPGK
jgi:hypothetical protein